MPPIIPQSLQPRQQQQMVKPPTVAEQRLIKQYGSVERARAIKAQQQITTQTIPKDAITKKDINSMISQTNAEIKKAQADRTSEYKRMEAFAESSNRNLNENELQRFNAKWTLLQTQLAAKERSLSKLKGQVGEGYVSKSSVDKYIAGHVGQVASDIKQWKSFERGRTTARKEQAIYSDIVTKFGTTLEPQEILQLTPQQAKVIGISQEDISGLKSISPKTPSVYSEIKRYESIGYAPSSAEKIAEWSVSHQQTPSPQQIQKILKSPLLKDISFDTGSPFSFIQPSPTYELPRESRVEAYDPTFQISKTISEASRESFGRIRSDVKTLFSPKTTTRYSAISGGDYLSNKEYYGYGDWFTPFKFVGKTKKEKEEEKRKGRIDSPTGFLKIGSISPTDTKPFQTFGDIQPDPFLDVQQYTHYVDKNMALHKLSQDISKQIESNLLPKYQDLINNNQLSVEEANINYQEEANKIYKKLFQEKELRLSKAKDYYGDYKKTGAVVPSIFSFGVEVGSMVTPMTSVIMGGSKAKEFMEKTPYILEDKSKGLSLYPDYTEKDLGTSLYFGVAGISSLGKLRGIEKGIVKTELQELSKQPIGFAEVIFKGKDKSKVFIKAGQKYNQLDRTIEVFGDVFKIGSSGKSFIMPSGEGVATTSGKLSWNILGGTKPTYLISSSLFDVGAKGMTFKIGESGKLFGTIGTTTTIPKASTGLFFQTKTVSLSPYVIFPSPKLRFIGTKQAERSGKYISRELIENLRFGGQIKKDLSGSLSYKFKDKTFGDMFAIKTTTGDFGFGKVITPITKTDIKIFRGGGTKTSFSKTFGTAIKEDTISKTISEPISVSGVFLEGAKTISKTATGQAIDIIPKSSSSLFGLGLLGGSKLITKQDSQLSIQPRVEDKTKIISQLKVKAETKQKEITKEETAVSQKLITSTIFNTSLKEGIVAIQPSKQIESQVTELKQEQSLIFPIPFSQNLKSPIFAGEFGFGLGGFMLPPKKKDYQKGQRIGYNVSVKSKGKYKRVNEKPHTKPAAIDVGARYTDNLLSAEFKISPIKQTKIIKGKKRILIKRFREEELKKGDNYYEKVKHKFRDFMIRKGKKIPMKDRWIEKKQYRNDTKTEQKGLTLFQFKARETKRRKGLPTRKTKKKRNNKKRFRL